MPTIIVVIIKLAWHFTLVHNLFMYTIKLNQGVEIMGLETGLLNNIN
jgi:hypothetical protein